MPPQLGQQLLRVRNLLFDMGDRRSAVLQLSETFREITISQRIGSGVLTYSDGGATCACYLF
jgi:hypothetical protein